MYQPFIVISSVHYLKNYKNSDLKHLMIFGMKVMMNIDDYEERYKKILLLILELNNKSIEELNNLYKSLKHICIYNRNHY